jgi:hypothetical protein
MSERGDVWLSRGFSVTCILSAFIGALMVGMLLGEARFSTSLSPVLSAFCFDSEKDDLAGKVLGMLQAKGL